MVAPLSRNRASTSSQRVRIAGSSASGKYSRGRPMVSSDIGREAAWRYSGTGTSAEVASMGSRPAMMCVASAASSTVRPNTPTWSSDDANATRPNRLTRPYVGFTPTTPQNAAGCRTDPPVSDPSAIGTTPAATAAADPPDEPPGTRVQSTGFNVGPNALCSVDDPIANSSMFVLQAMTAPAARSRVTTVASYGLTYPSRMREPQDVGIRNVAMLSLI